jgi:Fe2+ or Zn2+ uptake regulation protein
MIRILQLLIFGHVCKWKATGQARYTYASGPVVYAVCEKCGKRRAFEDSVMGDWEK